MVKLKNQSGFTVVEVLIGIALFGVIMPAIIMALVDVSRLNDRAADLSRANIIAEEKVESLRSAGYNSLLNGTYNFTNDLSASFTAPRVATYIITTPVLGVKKVDINIQYTDNGANRILEYSTLFGEIGIAQ